MEVLKYFMSENILTENHIALTSANDVKMICEPLFSLLELNYFSFQRVYANEERIRLCTNTKFVESYYKNCWYEHAFFERSPKLYYDGVCLWGQSAEFKRGTFRQYLQESFKINDMFSVIKTYGDYMDVYDFSTDKNKIDLGSICFSQVSLFERFIQYFSVSASMLIRQAAKEKFHVPLKNGKFFLDDFSGLQLNNKIKEFRQLTRPKNFYLISDCGETLLSKREAECLINVVKGRTAKQIAQVLRISYRTVETHVNNIKNKSGHNSINKLVEAALGSKGLLYFL